MALKRAKANPVIAANAEYPMAINVPDVGAAIAQQASEPARPLGVIQAGTIENYIPITDAMLEDPSPNDWPMIRRTYDASSYSPLDEINSDNVDDL